MGISKRDLGWFCAIALVVLFGNWKEAESGGRNPAVCTTPEFFKADANGDGSLDITDPLVLLLYLFQGGQAPVCFAQEENPDLAATVADLQADVDSMRAELAGVADNLPTAESVATELISNHFDSLPRGPQGQTGPPGPQGEQGEGFGTEEVAILSHMNIVDDGCETLLISGVNVQIVNGMDDTETTNCLGNLILGYNEDDFDANTNDRSGSHNLIIGPEHTYSNYGGLVAGFHNTASGPFASVSGGEFNTASGGTSSVGGGGNNTAGGEFAATVSGGEFNTANGEYASTVSGGSNNTASGGQSSVSGGYGNTAGANFSSVSGGRGNAAIGEWSSVNGGGDNTASGARSSVGGGENRSALEDDDWRAGNLLEDN